MEGMKANLNLAAFLQMVLEEDLKERGDVTSLATVPENLVGLAQIIAKQSGTIAGNWVAETVFKNVDPRLEYLTKVIDGESVTAGSVVAEIRGPVRGILTAERTALNLFGRLCGVATMTHQFVKKIAGTKTKILDTRKTTPGLRMLEKYAVTVGGGHNHRFGLFDMILIKENHIRAAGGLTAAVAQCRDFIARNGLKLKIEVETTNLAEVREALSTQVDRIMFDNMPVTLVKEALAVVNGAIEVEVSGGINLKNVRDYAELGVDYISVGGITHSVSVLDLSLQLIQTRLELDN